jgi:hypothetical protein
LKISSGPPPDHLLLPAPAAAVPRRGNPAEEADYGRVQANCSDNFFLSALSKNHWKKRNP